MNEKQQQLLFDKGITNVPSDALCSDNTLAESVGMVYVDGEHKVIQKPKEIGTTSAVIGRNLYTVCKLVYVHRHAGVIRYIYVYQVDSNPTYGLFYKTDANSGTGESFCNFLTSNNVSIETVGKTLIVNVNGKLLYFLWKTDLSTATYRYIGDKIPEIKVRFELDEFSNSDIQYNEKMIRLDGILDGITLSQPMETPFYGSKFKNGEYEHAKEALIGLVSMRFNQIHDNNRFLFPFWARSAMRLYDGSYIHISNPYLLLPTVRYNRDIFTSDTNGNVKRGFGSDKPGGWVETNYKPYYAKLKYRINRPDNYNDWKDIIGGVDIFVSEEAKTFNMEGQWIIQNVRNLNENEALSPNPYFDGNTRLKDYCQPKYNYSILPAFNVNDDQTCVVYFQPENYSDADIQSRLVDASVFYKIVEIDRPDLDNIVNGTQIDSSTTIRKGVLKNLTTQSQLDYDDYYSYTERSGEVMKAYNSRLHLANVRRTFFGGFGRFSYTSYDINGTIGYDYYVHINTNSGLRVVKGPETAVTTAEIKDIWYYYPDPRAFKVDIYRTGTNTLVVSLPLKEHHRLHGSFYFGRLPDDPNEALPAGTTVATPTVINTPEVLESVVMVSEVDNPFLFTAAGEITTNLGRIISIATQTMSLGENEHGLHPLTVFSERGISMLRVTDVGTYSRADEISREVCNNKESIAETDGPIFFSANKGLMVVVGNKVSCVSYQMDGKTNAFVDGSNNSLVINLGNFNDYLKSCFIAYDYRDSLLWIFNTTYTTCYIYSIKSGTFSKFTPDSKITNKVNDYPDYLLQTSSGKIDSLILRNDINNDSAIKYPAAMLTRPLKLESALALKSIMQIKHVHDINTSATLTLRIFASNNLKDWIELTSLKSVPWKYYRFRYDFTNLLATDRFAGTMLITQERRTNKLR